MARSPTGDSTATVFAYEEERRNRRQTARQVAAEAAQRQRVKVRENRLRRMAERQGYSLQKSRRRDPRAVDYGLYSIVDSHKNPVAGGGPGLTLDEVERRLTL
jgi:hypothetical protein